jgi:diguanylate cyclase (GGDEF)-like protein/PAS domain S-box-containing protein
MTERMAPLDDPARLRHLVAHLRVAVYVANVRGDILDANSAFLRLLGVGSLDELRTYGGNEMVVDLDRRHEQLDAIDRHGAVTNWEFQLVRPDGMILTVLDSCHVVRAADGGESVYCGALVDITDRKSLEDQLRQESLRDPLTGCFNRRYLASLAETLAAEQASWGCLYVDVDHFKQYNDQHGHQMGDNTLIRMSRFLMRQVRAEEPVFRVGGDEFVVVLRGATREQTALVADRLRAAALRTAPVPFSLGWAHREGAESVAQTINRADQNLLAVRVIERGTDRLSGGASVPA